MGDQPFSHCTVPNLLPGEFLDQLQAELSTLEFLEKCNDLYTFHQTADLATRQEACVRSLRQFLYTDLRPWMQHVLGVDLSERPNLFCAKYRQGDTLLCHDDELEGRCVAFILYLVPGEWTEADGGSLDLFDMDGGRPSDPVVSLIPARGNLSFFEVTPKSFHRVAEVLAADKCRLSVSGWYYGAPLQRPPLAPEPPLGQVKPGLDEDENWGDTMAAWLEWINEDYLEAGAMIGVNQQMEEESSVEMKGFLKAEKYAAVLSELKSSVQWAVTTPPNYRRFGSGGCIRVGGDLSDLPPTTKSLLEFLHSGPFFRYLRQLTELELVSVTGELRRFGHGDYTLLHDGDASMDVPSLDAVLYLCEDDVWKDEWGGFTSYFDKGEEEELLTINPKANTLALVFREQGTMRFVKYVNCRAPGPVFDVACAYLESEEAQKETAALGLQDPESPAAGAAVE